jgi:hypothetical protein
MTYEEYTSESIHLAEAFAEWVKPLMAVVAVTTAEDTVIREEDIPGLLSSIPSCPEDAEAALDLHHLTGGVQWGTPAWSRDPWQEVPE